jgi:TctA family transporter
MNGVLSVLLKQPGPKFRLFESRFPGIVTVAGIFTIAAGMPPELVHRPHHGLREADVHYRIIGPIILGAVIVGAYSIRNNMFDVWSAILFGLVGYVMKKRGWPIAPLILGFILGPLLEQHFRASIQGSGGSMLIFLQRPACAAFIFLGLLLMLMSRKLASRIPLEEEAGDAK